MSELDLPRAAQFVIKISKYCNLRCTYCYEYLDLGDKRRMPLVEIRRLFENVARHAEAYPFASVDFIWHGGEPFLIPVNYFHDIQAMQDEILDGKVEYSNAVQTNLTVLTEGHLDLLGEGGLFFGGLGISFDVFGDQRIDQRGKLRTDRIVTNMQKLRDAGIPFGAITVLARNTLPHVEAIYRYFDSHGIESRFLPFYMTAFEGQSSVHGLSFEELTAAFKLLTDAWITSERATPVEPVTEFLEYAIAYISDAPKRFYDRFRTELVYIINIDGGVWGVGEAYDPKDCYGNLFESPLAAVLSSPTRRRVTAEATERMERHCSKCEYFGYCPGFFVASATSEQQRLLAEHGCPVRTALAHLVTRLENSPIKDALLVTTNRPRLNEALSVAL